MSSRLSVLLHPLFIAIAPLLFFTAVNIGQLEVSELVLPTIAVLILTLVVGGVWVLILRDVEKASILTSLSLAIFFLHGHIHSAIVPDGVWSRYAHLPLLVLWVIVIGLTYWRLCHRKHELEKITKLFTTIATLLVAMGIVQLGLGYMAKVAIAKNLPRMSVLPQTKLDTAKRRTPDPSDGLPDIYYIILDGYARNDQLIKCYDFDNDEFLQFLENTGFYVASKSHSNYAHTWLSLASSLNLRFVTKEVNEIRKHSQHERDPLNDLIRANDVGKYLQVKGYQFIHFNTWWSGTKRSDIADINIANVSAANAPSDLTTGLLPLSEFQRIFAATTMFGPVVKILKLNETTFAVSHEHYINCFEKIKEIPQIDAPTFTLAHIISPHPPYFFDRDGNFLDADPSDRDWTKRKAYVDQLIYLNTQVRGIVKEIIAASDRRPIIIIQADHGTASLLRSKTWPSLVASPRTSSRSERVAERMSILNAYYLPESYRDQLYESISPVNSFRVVLNGLFDEDLPMLPDHAFFSWYPNVLNLVDVTSIMEGNGKRADNKRGGGSGEMAE